MWPRKLKPEHVPQIYVYTLFIWPGGRWQKKVKQISVLYLWQMAFFYNSILETAELGNRGLD